VPEPLFEYGDFAVYEDGPVLSLEEIGEEVDGDTFYQDLPHDQVELLRDALTLWLVDG
jgi:hypothetical protein